MPNPVAKMGCFSAGQMWKKSHRRRSTRGVFFFKIITLVERPLAVYFFWQWKFLTDKINVCF
jgi:hypothetical protein